MGLLDEAIREHLELKRRSGADPSAVAREEREALTPVVPDERDSAAADLVVGGLESTDVGEAAQGPSSGDEPLADMSAGGQETAELDMQAVMEEDPDAADSGSPEGPSVEGAPIAGHAEHGVAAESLEWGFPGERGSESAPEEVPGQERLSFE